MTKMISKQMVRVLAVVCLSAAVSAAPAPAQDKPADAAQHEHGGRGGGRMGGERQVERLTKELNLTPDQVTKVKEIEADTRTQMMALRDDTTTAEDKRAKAMALHQGAMAKVRDVLTEEQKTKFDAMQARMKERMQEHRGGGGEHEGGAPPPPPQ